MNCELGGSAEALAASREEPMKTFRIWCRGILNWAAVLGIAGGFIYRIWYGPSDEVRMIESSPAVYVLGAFSVLVTCLILKCMK